MLVEPRMGLCKRDWILCGDESRPKLSKIVDGKKSDMPYGPKSAKHLKKKVSCFKGH